MTDSHDASRSGLPRFSVLLLVIALCHIVWLGGLTVLTLVHRPTVVNQRQVRRADSVVLATIESVPKKRIRVESLLAGEAPKSESLLISNLDEVDVREGQQVIVPLWRTGRIVHVTNADKPGTGRPLVYEDTESVRAQLREALQRGPIRE